MPKSVKSKPAPTAQPVVKAPPPAPPVNNHPKPQRDIVYDKVGITEYSTTSGHGPMTVEDVRTMLWWETEPEWQVRMVELKGGKPEHYLFGETGPRREDTGEFQPVHCTNVAGEKVVCWNNAGNRPFDDSWSEDIESMILTGTWAGPHTCPGETVNGETVRVSRYGRVLSGQHQGTALVRADEKLQFARKKYGRERANEMYPVWAECDHCFIETIVITGLSEDERILRTIDYVKPRTVADMLFTTDLFRQNTPVERRDMTKMLASAIDLLWLRTDTKGYKTHPEVVGFLERHRSLLKHVEHLFIENSPSAGRKISKMRVSPGGAAALCYLMSCGSQKTTEYSDEYRNESPPSEKNLDWGYWDQAQKFWTCLASAREFMPVRTALGRLTDSSADSEDNTGLGGRLPEKLAVLAKAWERYRDHPASGGPAFDDADLKDDGLLTLSYTTLDEQGRRLPGGVVKLINVADFYGIDCPKRGTVGSGKTRNNPEDPPPPTKEEMEAALEEVRKRRMAAAGQ